MYLSTHKRADRLAPCVMAIPHFRGHIRKISTPGGVSWVGEYHSLAHRERHEAPTRDEASTWVRGVATEALSVHQLPGEQPTVAVEVPTLRLAA